MTLLDRYNGTLGHIYAHWPFYTLGFGGGVIAIAVLAVVSASQGWWSFVLLSLAALLLLVYLLVGLLWSAHRQYDTQAVYDTLYEMGGLGVDERFVHIDLGRRLPAMDLARRLTTGRLLVVDIYNPQLTPSPSLKRWRQRASTVRPDPRLLWRDGTLDLLPLADGTATAVTVIYTASYFWQHGDRLRLLQEVHRVMAPGGRLLMAERVRSRTNFVVLGLGAFRLHRAAYWRDLLRAAGFRLREERSLQGIVRCFCAEKPIPLAGEQLRLNL